MSVVARAPRVRARARLGLVGPKGEPGSLSTAAQVADLTLPSVKMWASAVEARNLYFGPGGWTFIANGPGSFVTVDPTTGDRVHYDAEINVAGANALATPVETYRIKAKGRLPDKWRSRSAFVEEFHLPGHGTNYGPAFNAAIAYLGQNGGSGEVLATQQPQYNIADTVAVNRSLIRLVGSCTGGLHDVGDLVTGGTKLKWTGADGGTMIRVKPIEGGDKQGISGWGAVGFALISGDWPYTSAAGRGIEIISAQRGVCDVSTSEFKDAAMYMSHTTNLAESFCSAYNEIWLHARQINTSGKVLVLDGDNTHDCYYNIFKVIRAQYLNGDCIDERVADNNIFEGCSRRKCRRKAPAARWSSAAVQWQRAPRAGIGSST